jgi:hypothetical protein
LPHLVPSPRSLASRAPLPEIALDSLKFVLDNQVVGVPAKPIVRGSREAGRRLGQASQTTVRRYSRRVRVNPKLAPFNQGIDPARSPVQRSRTIALANQTIGHKYNRHALKPGPSSQRTGRDSLRYAPRNLRQDLCNHSSLVRHSPRFVRSSRKIVRFNRSRVHSHVRSNRNPGRCHNSSNHVRSLWNGLRLNRSRDLHLNRSRGPHRSHRLGLSHNRNQGLSHSSRPGLNRVTKDDHGGSA